MVERSLNPYARYGKSVSQLDQVDLEASALLRVWKYKSHGAVRFRHLEPCHRLDCGGVFLPGDEDCLLCARPRVVGIQCIEPAWRRLLELAMANGG